MIVFAHGLEGTPTGRKVTAMRDAGLPVTAPDFQGMALADRVRLLDSVTSSGARVLAGSSYGGVAAAYLAQAHPGRFAALLLFAPALHLMEPPNTSPELLLAPAIPTWILHGTRDGVVPVAVSRAYRDRSVNPVRLVEVDDDHRLAESIPTLVALSRELYDR